jgi:hypothetical protein
MEIKILHNNFQCTFNINMFEVIIAVHTVIFLVCAHAVPQADNNVIKEHAPLNLQGQWV